MKDECRVCTGITLDRRFSNSTVRGLSVDTKELKYGIHNIEWEFMTKDANVDLSAREITWISHIEIIVRFRVILSFIVLSMGVEGYEESLG